jgi:signal peptide peptidase SppA
MASPSSPPSSATARGSKPIVAQVNSLAASAAYYIASAADEIVVTPSGEVGSIGVYCMHQDWSKALEQEGIAVQLISAGKFKTEGNPYEPLSADARDAMQARVDEYYDAFVRDVAAGRKVAMKTVREASAKAAWSARSRRSTAGMADKIAHARPDAGALRREDSYGFGAKAEAPAPAWSCATEGHEHTAEEEAAGCVAATEAALAQGTCPRRHARRVSRALDRAQLVAESTDSDSICASAASAAAPPRNTGFLLRRAAPRRGRGRVRLSDAPAHTRAQEAFMEH